MKQILLICLVLFCAPIDSGAQTERYYYGVNSKPLSGMSDANIYEVVTKKSDHKYIDSVFYSVDQDEVVIGWVVMEDGSLDGIITTKGKSMELNQFLVNTVAELPGYWTKPMLNGSPVRY